MSSAGSGSRRLFRGTKAGRPSNQLRSCTRNHLEKRPFGLVACAQFWSTLIMPYSRGSALPVKDVHGAKTVPVGKNVLTGESATDNMT